MPGNPGIIKVNSRVVCRAERECFRTRVCHLHTRDRGSMFDVIDNIPFNNTEDTFRVLMCSSPPVLFGGGGKEDRLNFPGADLIIKVILRAQVWTIENGTHQRADGII